jgi:coiled-coil and C2 domain-containing protein 2A
LFEPNRPLRVKRDEQKPIARSSQCNIIIQIVKATNLPVRWSKPVSAANSGSGSGGGSSTSINAGTNGADGNNGNGSRSGTRVGEANKSKLSSVQTLAISQSDPEVLQCLVESTFQGVSKPTFVSSSPNPRWNQVVRLPFNVNGNAYEPTVLSQIKDGIEFRLFDQVTRYTESPDYRLQNTRVESREQRFLGHVVVPFSTLYKQGFIEGSIEINTPLLPLGYQKIKPNEPSQLHFYMTMDPVVKVPNVPLRSLSNTGANPAYAFVMSWVQRVMGMGVWKKERALVGLVGDIYGQPQLVCRYLSPQVPPADCRYNPVVFTRFVSQIPFVEELSLPMDNQSMWKDTWCTSRQFLDLSAGGWDEHAILLANYFMWWDKQQGARNEEGLVWSTYCVVGTAIPDGQVVFVLRTAKRNGLTEEELFYNPVTGKCYNLDYDAYTLPLTHIGCMFDDTNIWANIQVQDRPIDLGLDVKNSFNWLPLFEGQFTLQQYSALLGRKWTTIQRSLADVYDEGKNNLVIKQEWDDKASRLNRVIEKHFEKWRVLPTPWNYGVCRILGEFLQELEIIEQKESDQLGNKNALAKIRANYPNMHGFPLHFSASEDTTELFEDSEDNLIVQAVKKCRIHENEDKDGSFALATYIYPYTAKIGSVWIYISALSSRAID